MTSHFICPDWPAPANVRALQTTRHGGVSLPPYNSLNLGDHVGDMPQAVARNRQQLNTFMPSEPAWLQQVHGINVIDTGSANCLPQADASFSRHRGSVCVVMTADCLPLLLCDQAGSVIAAVHAGWKGLLAGVIEATVLAMKIAPHQLLAWMGPAISQRAFEVGPEVREAFINKQPQANKAFIPSHHDKNKWMADLYLLARQHLNSLGITEIYGGGECTFSDSERFFSFRREGTTGRMGAFIWLE